MESLISAFTSLFAAANTLTPLALIGLMIGVLYIQIYRQPSKQELSVVRDNHLHQLPDIAANMDKAVDTLQRMEVSMEKNFATLISKLEGKR